jgi:hypothetical protein
MRVFLSIDFSSCIASFIYHYPDGWIFTLSCMYIAKYFDSSRLEMFPVETSRTDVDEVSRGYSLLTDSLEDLCTPYAI